MTAASGPEWYGAIQAELDSETDILNWQIGYWIEEWASKHKGLSQMGRTFDCVMNEAALSRAVKLFFSMGCSKPAATAICKIKFYEWSFNYMLVGWSITWACWRLGRMKTSSNISVLMPSHSRGGA